MFKIAPNKEK